MRPVFVNDNAFIWHDICDVSDHSRGNPGALAPITVLGPTDMVLGPKPMQNKVRVAIDVALRIAPPVALGHAMCRRPAEHERVVVELSGLCAFEGFGASAVIGERRQAKERNGDGRDREAKSAKSPHGLRPARLGYGPSSARPSRNC